MLTLKKKKVLLAIILLPSKDCFIFDGILTTHKRVYVLQLATAFLLLLAVLSGASKCTIRKYHRKPK